MKLAELFIQFTTKGIKEVQNALGNVKANLTQVQDGVQAVGRMATVSFAAATGALVLWTRAGLQNTTQLGAMQGQMERLSRGIASLFVPEINKAIGVIAQAANWFEKLTGAQQENIKRWIESAVAGLGVAMVMPKIVAGLSIVVQGVYGLATAMFTLNVASGGIFKLLGMLATALVGLSVGGVVAKEGLGGLFNRLLPLVETFGRLYEALRPLIEQGLSLLSGALLFVGKAIESALPFIQQFGAMMSNAMAEIGAAVGPVLPPLLDALKGIFSALTPLLEPIGKLVAALVSMLAPALSIVASAFTALLMIIRPVVKVIADLVGWIMDKLAIALRALAKLLDFASKGGKDMVKDFQKLDIGRLPKSSDGESRGKRAARLLKERYAGAGEDAVPGGDETGSGGKPRSDVEIKRTGTEAIMATISRFQQAIIAKDWQQETAKTTSNIFELLKTQFEKGRAGSQSQPAFAP